MVKPVPFLILLLYLLSSCMTDSETLETSAPTVQSADISQYRSRPVEPVVLEAVDSSDAAEAPDELVDFLLKDVSDPFLKIKIIHDWICLNIAYDTEGFFSGNIASVDSSDVLSSGKSVCSGYSGVFELLAGLAGFETVTIPGDAKGYGFNPFEESEMDVSHAWNAVKINDEWFLLDTTWDSGHVEGGDFVFEYSTGYLFLNPSFMIYTHFPEDEEWQLLDDKVDFHEYRRLHYLNGEFFSFFQLNEPLSIIETGGLVTLPLDYGEDIPLLVFLADENDLELPNRASVAMDDNGIRLMAAPPVEGQYKLRIFAGNGDDFDFLGDILIKSLKGINVRFPLFYTDYYAKGFRLVDPADHVLKIKGANVVTLQAPGWKEAFIQMGDEQIPMSKSDGDMFSAKVVYRKDRELTIYGTAGSGRDGYSGAATLYFN